MIDCLIFTKDRACQLDLLLRSLNDNFLQDLNINIIYKATDGLYLAAYNNLIKSYPQYNWFFETDFVSQSREVFNSFKNEFMVNFVDDEIVIRKDSIEPALDLLRDESVHGISLRMNPSISYCYTANKPDPQPIFQTEGDLYKWNWRSMDPTVNWGYPSCINSHVYKTADFKKYLSGIKYDTVNGLEGMYNNIKSTFRMYMVCFNKSKTINIANNLVQTGTNRHGTNQAFSLQSLNDKFLDGGRLSTNGLYNIDNQMATFEKDYEWES